MQRIASLFGVGVAVGAAGALWTVSHLGGGSVLLDKAQSDGRSSTQVFFSPKGGCTDAIVEAIASAEKRVIVQAYSFTSDPIRGALVAAHRRGVQVQVILDRQAGEDPGSELKTLVKSGINVWTDGEHPIAHNKIIVIDEGLVVTGSFNFTRQAETGNAENILVIHSPELAARYVTNWEVHRDHSSHVSRSAR